LSTKEISVGLKASIGPSRDTRSDHDGSIVVSPSERGSEERTQLYASCGTLLLPNLANAMGGEMKIERISSAIAERLQSQSLSAAEIICGCDTMCSRYRKSAEVCNRNESGGDAGRRIV